MDVLLPEVSQAWISNFRLATDGNSDSIMCSKSEQSIDDWIGFDWVGGLTSWSEERKWRGVSDNHMYRGLLTDRIRETGA